MEFKLFRRFDDLATYREEWNLLVKCSASQVPFLTFEYLQAWWETRGGGEWPDESKLVLVAAFQDQTLVGAAPLFLTNNSPGQPVMKFIGAVEVSDYLDFIAHSQDLPTFITGLLDFLASDPGIPLWESLELDNLLEDTPTLSILETEAEERGWTVNKAHLQPAPYAQLTEDFESYLAGLDKKQRHEIRRKIRRIEGELNDVQLTFTTNAEDLEADIDAFIEMMAQDPNKKIFLKDKMRQHLHRTAQVAFDHHWLQLSFLTLDGKKAAAHMSFIYDNRIWLYNSGWEWAYRDFSPGWVQLAYLIRWATENGIEVFDFMRGDEPYKYKFGGVDRHVWQVRLTPGNR